MKPLGFRKLTLNVVKGIIYLKMEMTMEMIADFDTKTNDWKSTMEILVDVKNVYGNILYYPACSQSEIFAKIAGNKTLTGDTLRQIKELGITVTAKTSQI